MFVYIKTLYEDMLENFDTGNYDHSCIYLELVDGEWVIDEDERSLEKFLVDVLNFDDYTAYEDIATARA